MKTSLKILFFVAMPLAASVGWANAADTAPAPEGKHPRAQEMREHRMKQLEEKLNLTADQKTKIAAIWTKAEQGARAARQEASATAREELRAQRMAAMKAARQEVRSVLTAEQQAIFDAMPADRGRDGARRAGAKK